MVWNVLRNEKLRLLPSDVSLAQLRANMKNLHDWHYDADSISWHLQMLKMKITVFLPTKKNDLQSLTSLRNSVGEV